MLIEMAYLDVKLCMKIDFCKIRWEIPIRSYAEEGVVAVFIPLVVLLLLAALLTAILGIHPEGAETEEGQVIFNTYFALKNLTTIHYTCFSFA